MMEALILTGKSLTHAQMMQRCLERGGLSCATVRTPEKLRETGCGYAVRIRKADLVAALALLQRGGLAARKVYRVIPPDRYEEVRP